MNHQPINTTNRINLENTTGPTSINKSKDPRPGLYLLDEKSGGQIRAGDGKDVFAYNNSITKTPAEIDGGGGYDRLYLNFSVEDALKALKEGGYSFQLFDGGFALSFPFKDNSIGSTIFKSIEEIQFKDSSFDLRDERRLSELIGALRDAGIKVDDQRTPVDYRHAHRYYDHPYPYYNHSHYPPPNTHSYSQVSYSPDPHRHSHYPPPNTYPYSQASYYPYPPHPHTYSHSHSQASHYPYPPHPHTYSHSHSYYTTLEPGKKETASFDLEEWDGEPHTIVNFSPEEDELKFPDLKPGENIAYVENRDGTFGVHVLRPRDLSSPGGGLSSRVMTIVPEENNNSNSNSSLLEAII